MQTYFKISRSGMLFLTLCLAAMMVLGRFSSIDYADCPNDIQICTPDSSQPDRGENFSCCANCHWLRAMENQATFPLQYYTSTSVVLHLPPNDDAFGVYMCVFNDTGVVNRTLFFVTEGECL